MRQGANVAAVARARSQKFVRQDMCDPNDDALSLSARVDTSTLLAKPGAKVDTSQCVAMGEGLHQSVVDVPAFFTVSAVSQFF